MDINLDDVKVKILDSYKENTELKLNLSRGKSCKNYNYQTDGAFCYVSAFKIDLAEAMPAEQDKELANAIRGFLKENQGIIEVESGITKTGYDYVVTIVKTVIESRGVIYNLRMHLATETGVAEFNCLFQEVGETGLRDALIFDQEMKAGNIKWGEGFKETWMKDPYDPNYKQGILKNLSEDKKYNEMFPNHPLTQCYKFIEYILENN